MGDSGFTGGYITKLIYKPTDTVLRGCNASLVDIEDTVRDSWVCTKVVRCDHLNYVIYFSVNLNTGAITFKNHPKNAKSMYPLSIDKGYVFLDRDNEETNPEYISATTDSGETKPLSMLFKEIISKDIDDIEKKQFVEHQPPRNLHTGYTNLILFQWVSKPFASYAEKSKFCMLATLTFNNYNIEYNKVAYLASKKKLFNNTPKYVRVLSFTDNSIDTLSYNINLANDVIENYQEVRKTRVNVIIDEVKKTISIGKLYNMYREGFLILGMKIAITGEETPFKIPGTVLLKIFDEKDMKEFVTRKLYN